MPQSSFKDRIHDSREHLAVIDIGSNSVRLVVFDKMSRNPHILFNEKVLCGLGRMISKTGEMDDEAMAAALATLKRFQLLLKAMRIEAGHIEAVATAAVREASNGAAFIARIKSDTGIRVRVISGKEEAELSALGVLSGIPDADGIIGDLGGGSLELVEISKGAITEKITLPIGPLRLQGDFGDDQALISRKIMASLKDVPWLKARRNKNFYIVGGAWRAVSRVNMVQKKTPLPILHAFSLDGADAQDLAKLIAQQEPQSLAKINSVPSRRATVMPCAALILYHILDHMRPNKVITSSLGLREGLVYQRLPQSVKTEDPFIAAARDMAEIGGRFKEHGDRLMRWIDPLFESKTDRPELKRLRYGTCLLSDISWRGHPDYRAERAIMEALYGRFVGIDHKDRGFVGLALGRIYGASDGMPLASLCRSMLGEEDIRQALILGEALRLGHRISGGTSNLLKRVSLKRFSDRLVLDVEPDAHEIVNEVVARRFQNLAQIMNLRPEIAGLSDDAYGAISDLPIQA
ncbi:MULTISPECIES: Ppx/GppA family phosphatase [unclassified Iodidimonas]|uniref:Ppx/GppA phosphatase family protein n=1 Tax=unclassified Iodidimonas TaxID=2626145 RepID=UPI002482DCBC|nr:MULTISPECIES: Ppx/GppA family phosphatase [unclassified Iodidimonas]